MCGRFSQLVGKDILTKRFEIDETRSFSSPSFNIAPTNQINTVIRENPVVLTTMRWGFVPDNLALYDPSKTHINARDDRILELKMHTTAFKERRCLIPTSGFYEWQVSQKMNDAKTPYYIRLKHEELFAFAGIYSTKKPIDKFMKTVGTEPAVNLSCAILTTSPNELMEDIHNRMPAIISKEDEQLWLNPKADPNELLKLFKPYPADLMEAYPVSTFVNSPKNNSGKCIQKIDINTLLKQQMGLDQSQSTLDDFFC